MQQPEVSDWTRRAEPSEHLELMDEPCTYEDFRACLSDLEQVNRMSRGYEPTLLFLQHVAAKRNSTEPLKILDVGSGGGDLLRRVAEWAQRKSISVELTGIDINPYAARCARERDSSRTPIRWITGDAFSYDGPMDVVISSLVMHHLPTPNIVRFLAWMERGARSGWFINDLERSVRSARWFSLLSRVLFWHKFVRHDGPVSFRRSFIVSDWVWMLTEADIELTSCTIAKHRPGRLCVSRVK